MDTYQVQRDKNRQKNVKVAKFSEKQLVLKVGKLRKLYKQFPVGIDAATRESPWKLAMLCKI